MSVLDLADLFADGELRLQETDTGWRGFKLEDGVFYWVDTRYPDRWYGEVRVTDRAVRRMVARHLEDTGDAPRIPAGGAR